MNEPLAEADFSLFEEQVILNKFIEWLNEKEFMICKWHDVFKAWSPDDGHCKVFQRTIVSEYLEDRK